MTVLNPAEIAAGLAVGGLQDMDAAAEIRKQLGYSPSFQLYADRLPAVQSTRFNAAVDKLIADLKSAGIYDNSDVIYVGPAGAQSSSFVQVKGSTKTLSVGGGTVNFTAGAGNYGDGSTGYLLGPGAPDTFTKFVQDSASISIGVAYQRNGTGHLGRAGTTDSILALIGPNNITARINQSSSDTWSVLNSVGLTTINRTSSTAIEAFKDGVSLGSKTRTSAAVSSLAMSLFRANTTYGSDTLSYLRFGSALTADQAAQEAKAFNAFMAFFDWSPITVTTSTKTAISSSTMPAASGSGGEPFTNTGRVRDPQDGTYWNGNNGTTSPNGTTHVPSIVHTTANNEFIDEVTAASLGYSATTYSFQGVGYRTADHSIWGVLKDTTNGGGTRVIGFNKVTHTIVGDFSAADSTNGLTVDNDNDRLIVSGGGTLAFRSFADYSLIGNTYSITAPDQLSYINGRSILLATRGANGTLGVIDIYLLPGAVENVWGNAIALVGSVTTDAVAIEGVDYWDGEFTVNTDEDFHNVGTHVNEVRTYDASNGIL